MICSEVIKADTRKLHAEAEAVLIPRIKGIKTLEDYNKLLASFFGFFNPLETLIGNFIHPGILPDIDKRRKSKSIIKSFGSETLPTVATPQVLPEIDSLAQAFGAMYVLEGSTLGGKIIKRMMQANTALQLTEASLEFFDVYGDGTFEMWNHFRTVMDRLLTNETDITIAAETAGNTFVKLKTWMQKS